ncbi:MAG TPA: hypothetical protein VE338_15460 [Ktedonobacterales bacterium]|nr:hypothetical protein [Ktedonobacterales bacterium]
MQRGDGGLLAGDDVLLRGEGGPQLREFCYERFEGRLLGCHDRLTS